MRNFIGLITLSVSLLLASSSKAEELPNEPYNYWVFHQKSDGAKAIKLMVGNEESGPGGWYGVYNYTMSTLDVCFELKHGNGSYFNECIRVPHFDYAVGSHYGCWEKSAQGGCSHGRLTSVTIVEEK